MGMLRNVFDFFYGFAILIGAFGLMALGFLALPLLVYAVCSDNAYLFFGMLAFVIVAGLPKTIEDHKKFKAQRKTVSVRAA
jgi:hypothetical protein